VRIRGESFPKYVTKRAIATINRPLASRRLAAALGRPGPHKLVIGAGRTRFDGWLATDIAWNAPMYLDATKPWPFPEASVSHVYGDHMIEYATLPGTRALLCHAMRALQPGGAIRLSSPDVERIARVYLEGPAELRRLCMEQNRKSGYEVHYPVDLLRNTFVEAGHQDGYLFDFASLAEEFREAGFVDVKRYESGESDDPELRGLEDRASTAGAVRELIVQGRKPATGTQ
jgi:predicted SAM-dependent methyltransferase